MDEEPQMNKTSTILNTKLGGGPKDEHKQHCAQHVDEENRMNAKGDMFDTAFGYIEMNEHDCCGTQ